MVAESVLRAQLDHTIADTDFAGLGPRYRGKVRDTYRRGDHLILITTDRISAFDHILKQGIPFKGQVLNRLAAYFFSHTSDVIRNHVIDVPDPNVTIAERCEPVPVEFVVRGYLAGHAWREYNAGKRTLCGKSLPEGLRQNSALPEPVLTPATKASSGHDEDISREGILDRRILDADTFDYLEEKAIALFRRGSDMARKQGLILVDTKYEFGKTRDGAYVLIDEVHTPDSSRYFYAETYQSLLEADQPQRQLSKEFLREWLMERDFQGKEGQIMPDLSDDFRIEVARRYIELFETVTGNPFEPDVSDAPLERIDAVLSRHPLLA